MISLAQLKERKVVQWALAYLAGAWVVLQVADLVGTQFGWPVLWLRGLTVVLACGFFAALIVAWYHGEKGAQKVSTVELGLLFGVLVLAGVGVGWVRGPSEPAERSSTPALAAAFRADVAVAEQGSIAVLPFVNMSPDPEQEFFADGITEELLNVLAQLPELRVASRTSAFSFRGTAVGIDSIARALRVQHVLEGSVRKAGERVRITAQLIDAASGYHLWSDTYDRELRDIFAVQDEIARAIVEQLQIRLPAARAQAPLARVETSDPEAYTLYLKAYQIMLRSTRESADEAESLLRQALARDPEYAQAHALLGTVQALQARAGWVPPEEGYGRADASARRALALNPAEARAHVVLGQIARWRERDWAAAERHFARALEANPGFAPAHNARAPLLMLLGRTEEAIRSARRAVELNPVVPAVYSTLGGLLWFAEEPEQAEQALREGLRLAPGGPGLLNGVAYVYSGMGRHAEAIRAAEQVHEADPGPARLSTLAHVQARAGNRAEAERLLGRMEAMPEAEALDLAYVYVALGNRERVLELLERAYENREAGIELIGVDPVFREYRREPRVRRLLERMGLPAPGR